MRTRLKNCACSFDSTEKTAAALPKFPAIPGVAVVQGSPDNIEVTAAGVDKGSALLALADLLGIPHENTLAGGRQRERPRHAGKGRDRRCYGQRNAPDQGHWQHCERSRLRSRRRCRAVRQAWYLSKRGSKQPCFSGHSSFFVQCIQALMQNIVLVEHYQTCFRRLY